MKTQILLFVLSTLVLSAPKAEPEPAADPQLQGLIPLAIGGLALGAIGSAAYGTVAGAARDCDCARNFQPPPCSGSWVSSF